jgi:4-carboxymuconolactone decarboxylase
MNRDAFEKGLKTRREVLGAEYVDQSIQNADEFNRPMQELVTEYCWNEIWNRPGLDRKTRSIVNLAMITALNRPHELKLHIKGAINNGLTKDEIREIFLQTEMPKRYLKRWASNWHQPILNQSPNLDDAS